MRIINNLMHSLTLPITMLAAVIHTSWSADVNITESHINPLNSKFSHFSRQVDDRISDLIAENVLHFGHNLGLELAALEQPHEYKSEIFSPLSIMAALSLLTLGAKGRSYQELKQLLGLDSDSELIQNPSKYHQEFGLMLNDLQHTNVNSDGISKRRNANWRFTKLRAAPVRSANRTKPPVQHIIKVTNGLFVQSGYSLNPDYSQVLQSIYDSELQQLDFYLKNREARDFINDWISKATFGKIPQIINGDIEKSTNIILASALYFKAFWETSFFPRATSEDNFYPDGFHNPPIKVQMMPTGGVFPFYDAKEYDCRIIGLPYKGNETTMYVIQPNNSTRQRLRDLQHVLSAHKINAMINKMERKTTVMVFPKMHFTRSMTMKKILKTMNVQNIFINGYSDLSLIGGRPQKTYDAPLSPLLEQKPALKEFVPPKTVVSFESINRQIPIYQRPQLLDRYDEPALIFSSRFGEIERACNNTVSAKVNVTTTTEKPSIATVTTKASSERIKRQVSLNNGDPATAALLNLEANRLKADTYQTDLFVDDIIHKVDFSVDEQGTEAAAATLTYLHRSGTDVVFRGDTPFLIIIRHDPTKLPLFYGIINKPVF